MIEFPHFIKVLGQTFTVEVIGSREALSRGAPFEGIGITDLNLQYIKVRGAEDISYDKAVEVLVHEVLHAMWDLFGLAALQTNADDHDHQGEQLVNALAPALLHTLRENPALVATIMREGPHGQD